MTLQEVIDILKDRKVEADRDFEEYGADLYDEVCIACSATANTLENVIKMLEEVES